MFSKFLKGCSSTDLTIASCALFVLLAGLCVLGYVVSTGDLSTLGPVGWFCLGVGIMFSCNAFAYLLLCRKG